MRRPGPPVCPPACPSHKAGIVPALAGTYGTTGEMLMAGYSQPTRNAGSRARYLLPDGRLAKAVGIPRSQDEDTPLLSCGVDPFHQSHRPGATKRNLSHLSFEVPFSNTL